MEVTIEAHVQGRARRKLSELRCLSAYDVMHRHLQCPFASATAFPHVANSGTYVTCVGDRSCPAMETQLDMIMKHDVIVPNRHSRSHIVLTLISNNATP